MRPAAGSLLVANPKLMDPNFVQSVVYLIEHNDEGTFGVVINRPLDLPLDAIWDEAPAGLREHRIAAQGGPVEPTKGLLLHGDLDLDGCHVLGRGVAIGGELGALTARWASGPDRRGPRLFLGTSGWSPGQLDAELEAGSWLVRSGDADLLFDPAPPDHLWRRLVEGPAGPVEPSVN